MCENSSIVYPKFSVLMSLYYKEQPSYLRECFDSLLNQTVKADEWVIVKDGPLTKELEEVLKEYGCKYPELIRYVIFDKNQGLGLALKSGVEVCSNEIIARMDTDDICREDRFEKELYEFICDPDLDIVGSHIKEFDGNIENVISARKVPLSNEEIVSYQKKRSAFNHMTVMYKRSSVLSSGNYEHCPLMEDDMLWTRMILNNCKMKNIDDYLVYVRTGTAMIERRGGWAYFKKYKSAKKKIKETGFINSYDYYLTLAIQLVISLMPNGLRMWIFKKALR